MCIGVPMQVISSHPHHAVCQTRYGEPVEIDTRLVGQQKPGAWLLTFLNAAREVISEQRAHQTLDALEALNLVANGNNIDHLFADLVDREPQLPDFLRPTKPKS